MKIAFLTFIVNDQKIQQQLTAGMFFSYKSAVVNYRWGYFSFFTCIFKKYRKSEKKSNFLARYI